MYFLCLSDDGSASRPSVDSDGASVGRNDVIGGLVANVKEMSFCGYFVCPICFRYKPLAHTNVKNIEKLKTKGMLKYDTKDFDKNVKLV